jgi:hypothetical protein
MTDYSNNLRGFVSEVIEPVVTGLGLDAEPAGAVQLLLGTALQESGGLVYRVQLGGGPARGLFQMEPNTHDDIWDNFLQYRHTLADKVRQFLGAGEEEDAQLLTDNDKYAAAMARVQYYRMGQVVGKRPIPAANDIAAMAAYWKSYYNTGFGAGTDAEFLTTWDTHGGNLA